MISIRSHLVVGLLGLTLNSVLPAALAQNEGPAVQTSDFGRAPLPAAAAASSEAAPNESGGTVIIGDRESPIGLYIMPWRDSSAAADMDRPARLVKANLLPIDKPVFSRELQYHRALTGALAERNQVTPETPVRTSP